VDRVAPADRDASARHRASRRLRRSKSVEYCADATSLGSALVPECSPRISTPCTQRGPQNPRHPSQAQDDFFEDALSRENDVHTRFADEMLWRMPEFEIRRITTEETIPLRHPILRPGLPRETAIFPGDEAETSRHFGAFLDGAHHPERR